MPTYVNDVWELTFSPAYHPILPLLCDLETAREARPDIELPARRFSHPEDGKRQLELGREEFRRLTGVRPRGLWPPELAVAEDMVGQAVERIQNSDLCELIVTNSIPLSPEKKIDKITQVFLPAVVEVAGEIVEDQHVVFRTDVLFEGQRAVRDGWPADVLIAIKQTVKGGLMIVTTSDDQNAQRRLVGCGRGRLRQRIRGQKGQHAREHDDSTLNRGFHAPILAARPKESIAYERQFL